MALADEALALAERIQPYPLDLSFLHAARVEALGQLGDPREGEARAVARARIEKAAATLAGHDELQRAYLELPAHQL